MFEHLQAVLIDQDVNVQHSLNQAMGKKRKKMGKFGNESMMGP
jgi:hypothetical protein